ncbi:hypothetical protein FRC12_023282 [Ceratobasidium sp. 428]|nr:hypothetical protein FRC12_023282 [Ceratobasidium sp. 428]
MLTLLPTDICTASKSLTTLTRKNKAHDEYDICLSDGTKYWVKQEEYKAHLEANKDTAYEQSTRAHSFTNRESIATIIERQMILGFAVLV